MRYSNKDFEMYRELKQRLQTAKFEYLNAYEEWSYFNLRAIDKGFDIEKLCTYPIFEK